MAALMSKPGITRLATTSSVPKEWSQTWFRDFISDHLKLADVRNATSPTGTIKIGGTLTGYGTLDITNPLKLPGGLGVYGNIPPAQIAGVGTPTGVVRLTNFPGAAATLAQTSAWVAALITDLKAIGFYAA